MSKLIINVSSFNDICFLLVLFLQFLRETSKKHSQPSLFVLLRFVVLDPPLIL